MENVSEKIYSILEKIGETYLKPLPSIKIERPSDINHGDFSTNIALVLFRNLQKQSFKGTFELSEDIVKKIKELPKDNISMFERIEAMRPGFINFYLSKDYLQNQIQNIIREGSAYGSLSIGNGKKASVEFVSANPTGPLHIGNARGGPLGDTIANVLSKAGYEVTREYLHNDVGGQVDRLGEALYFELNPGQKPIDYEVQYQGRYLKELAQKVEETMYEDEDLSQGEFIEKAGKVAVKIMLEEILEDCKLMGVTYDKIRKESDLRKEVPSVLEKLKKILKKQDGAVWFAPNDEFLKDRETVVKKSNGQYTYFASDIAYHDEKMAGNDLVVDVLGSNHSGHLPRLLAIIKALNYPIENFRCILYQYVRLKRNGEVVKMSKRAGNFVTAREVLDEVGRDAFRFFLLTPRTQTHMDFDLELAKRKSAENPVYYVQYAHTRIVSIFEKSKLKTAEGADLSFLSSNEELNLIRKVLVLPYLIEDVSRSLEVNTLVNYSLELATHFHKFYEAHRVISKDTKLTEARLALLKATQITLKSTLDLLGVSAPSTM